MKSSDNPVIGIISWDFLDPKGGMGYSFRWIAEALSVENAVVVGTPATAMGAPHISMSPLLSFTRSFGGHILFSLCLPFVLRRWIKRHGITLLLIPGGPGGVFLLRDPGVPYICSVYHVYEQQARLVPGQRWKKIFVPFERRTYRRALRLLTFNEDARTVLHLAYDVPKEKMMSLSHAIETHRWKGSAEHQKQKGLCVCVARLEARKGIDVLLDSWPYVSALVPASHLVIVGRGRQAADIDALIASIGSSVERVESLLLPDLIALIQRADVCICPSYLEGFGLSAAEAMAAGTAVVASDAEGLRCLIRDGETGFLFKTGEGDALSETIAAALQNDDRRHATALRAQTEAMDRFDSQRASDALRRAVTATLFTKDT